MKNIGKEKNNIANFIEHFCYIKDKKTNIYKQIKLSNLQKEFINYLNNYDKRNVYIFATKIL